MERIGRYMKTYTGKHFYPYDARAEDICIEDIAYGLAGELRFGSQSPRRISVAEHSILVSETVPPEYALQGLLHDASEAYIKDIPSPAKTNLMSYYELEGDVMQVIGDRFGLSRGFAHLPTLKKADYEVLQWEINAAWDLTEDNAWRRVHGYSAQRAEELFLRRFWELYHP